MSPLISAILAATDFGIANPISKFARLAAESSIERDVRGNREPEWHPSAVKFFAIMRDAIGERSTRATLRAWRAVEDRRKNAERLAAWENKAENFAEFGRVGKKLVRPGPRAIAQIMPKIAAGGSK